VVGQQVVPPGQMAEPLGHWQLPLVQVVPPVQALPHAAQLVFVPRVVQTPLQSAWPLGHWQAPLTQFSPPVQALPQAAQFWFVPSDAQVPPQQCLPARQQTTAVLPAAGHAHRLPLLSRQRAQLLTHWLKAPPPGGLIPHVLRQKFWHGELVGALNARCPRPREARMPPSRPPPNRRSASRRESPPATSRAS
jgi:hypothetical protein